MDQNSSPKNSVPVQTTVPEEDAKLLAIEALEARNVDLDPRPLNAPRDIPVPARSAQAFHAKPVVPTTKPAAPPSKPVVAAKPIATSPKPIEIKPMPTPPPKAIVPPTPPKAPTPTPKPKKPATPSEAMAEELKNAPIVSRFQFFINQGAPRKPFLIIGGVLIIVGIGVAVFFATR